jgi:hypothetical protein
MRAAVALLLTCVFSVAAQDRLPPPDAEAQKTPDKTIKDLFKAEYAKATPADRAALAAKLLKQGGEEADPTTKYVLLREARDLATQAGDADLAWKAVEALDKTFNIDGLEELFAAMGKVETAAKTPEAALPLAHRFATVSARAVAIDKYDLALKALTRASAAAAAAKDLPLTGKLKEQTKTVQALQREYSSVQNALKVLEDKPDDPVSNLQAGKFFCLSKHDFARGIPYLAKSTDSTLKPLAERELTKSDTDENRMALADHWWDSGEKQPPPQKAIFQGRAVYWYEAAGQKLAGLARAKAIQRIDAYDKSIGRVRVNPVLTADEQLKLLADRLKEANPNFDGKLRHTLGQDGKITEIDLGGAPISNISALQGMLLIRLNLTSTKVSDISPLNDMPLEYLNLWGTFVRDLTPLKGAPLRELVLSYTKVTDFSLIAAFPLEVFACEGLNFRDLGLLKNAQLRELFIAGSAVTDMTPVLGMKLQTVSLMPKVVTKGLDGIRNMKTIMSVGQHSSELMPPEEFWKKFDANQLNKK